MANRNQEGGKTDRLREIFLEVADEKTVTEQQDQTTGAVYDSGARENVDAEIETIIDDLRAEYGLDTSLDTTQLTTLVRRFYAEESDTEIARALGDASLDRTVARARVKLQLFRDSDFDAPFEINRLHDLMDSECPTTEIAEELGVSESTVRAYQRVLIAEQQAAASNFTYRDQFAAVVAAENKGGETETRTLDDGLADAIDGAEHGQS